MYMHALDLQLTVRPGDQAETPIKVKSSTTAELVGELF